MATIVTRAGKGSELTHNEVDANFTNLNTNKLEVGFGGLGATIAEINRTDDSANAISGFTSGMRLYLNNDGASLTGFDFVTNVTEGTFESVGPTGSSATNIWTAMDSMPSDAKIAILQVITSVDPDGADRVATFATYARQTGSSNGTGNSTSVQHNYVVADDFTAGSAVLGTMIFVPLDSSRRFDITWGATNDDARTGNVFLKGFMN